MNAFHFLLFFVQLSIMHGWNQGFCNDLFRLEEKYIGKKYVATYEAHNLNEVYRMILFLRVWRT